MTIRYRVEAGLPPTDGTEFLALFWEDFRVRSAAFRVAAEVAQTSFGDGMWHTRVQKIETLAYFCNDNTVSDWCAHCGWHRDAHKEKFVPSPGVRVFACKKFQQQGEWP